MNFRGRPVAGPRHLSSAPELQDWQLPPQNAPYDFKYENGTFYYVVAAEGKSRKLEDNWSYRRDRAGVGGTELLLILRDTTVRDIPVLDTIRIHVRAIMAQAFS